MLLGDIGCFGALIGFLLAGCCWHPGAKTSQSPKSIVAMVGDGSFAKSRGDGVETSRLPGRHLGHFGEAALKLGADPWIACAIMLGPFGAMHHERYLSLPELSSSEVSMMPPPWPLQTSAWPSEQGNRRAESKLEA